MELKIKKPLLRALFYLAEREGFATPCFAFNSL
jgi:hypothetical protein